MKFNRHQGFQNEIISNKERLNKLKGEVDGARATKPEVAALVDPELDDLSRRWDELETYLKDKGTRLFDANRGEIFQQNVQDMDSWMDTLQGQMIPADDVTTESLSDVDKELKKHQVHSYFILHF